MLQLMCSREEMLERLIAAYSNYFDIERYGEGRLPLAASCHFHVRSAKYVLLKRAELWSAESNEHVYIFTVPELTAEVYHACENIAYEEGMKLIHPDRNHMYTYITAVFLCDTCTEEAKKCVRRCRIYKSFHFSLYGWMDFHTVLLQQGANKFVTNPSGRDNAKLMKNIFMNRKERRE